MIKKRRRINTGAAFLRLSKKQIIDQENLQCDDNRNAEHELFVPRFVMDRVHGQQHGR